MDDVDNIVAQWRTMRPDLDVSAMEIIGRFSRVAEQNRKGMEETFSAHGLNGPSFDVLATLRRSNAAHALTPGELMASMMITSGTTTNRIDRLVSAGLVERKADSKDARKTWVCLTPEGRAKVDQVLPRHIETQKGLLNGLTEEEAAVLNTLLRKLLAKRAQAPEPSET